MAISGYGDRGQPIFTQAPRTRADFQENADYARKVGNHIADTAAARTQATAAGKVWDGLDWFETDTNIFWRRRAGAWRALDSEWATYNASPLSGISIGSGGSATTYFAWRYSAGEVEVKWNLVLGSNGFVNGDIAFGLPVQTGQVHFYDDLGQVRFIKTGQAPLTGGVGVNGTLAFVRTQSGNNGVEGVATASSPFTWAAGDRCVGRLRYTPA